MTTFRPAQTDFHFLEFISQAFEFNGHPDAEHRTAGTGKHMESQRTLRLYLFMANQSHGSLSAAADDVLQLASLLTIERQAEQIAHDVFIHIVKSLLSVV